MKDVQMRIAPIVVTIALLPGVAWAQEGHEGHGTHGHSAAPDALVDFGVFPAAPLGPLPCLQTGAIGGPADPCSFKLHRLVPEEVTVRKGGQVTFQIHGGGHSIAIYEVSRNTTRDEVGQFLCPGTDPTTLEAPTEHLCNLNVPNANAEHLITDGRGKVVIVAAPNVTNTHPDNRVWYEPGRLMSAGGQQLLNGGTTPAGAASNGQLITYRFLEIGRYLVICANRTHFLNDWMFGFVDVVGAREKQNEP